MALKIRMRQQGRTNRKLYRLIVTETTAARDGRYVEMLGWFNPHEKDEEQQLSIATDRVQHWLNQGAEMTGKSKALIERAAPEVVKAHIAKAVAKRNAECAKRKKRKAA
jgi:small subunit ribosomal protein S16